MALLGAALLSACGGESDTAEEVPADVATTVEVERQTSQKGVLGEPQTLPSGAILTIDAIRLNDPEAEWEPSHLVDIRMDNPTAEALEFVDMRLRCAENESDSHFATYGFDTNLPAGSSREGAVSLSAPDLEGVAKTCLGPIIRVTDAGFTIDYPAPDFVK